MDATEPDRPRGESAFVYARQAARDSMTPAADAMRNELLRITTLLRPQVAEVSEASDARVLVG